MGAHSSVRRSYSGKCCLEANVCHRFGRCSIHQLKHSRLPRKSLTAVAAMKVRPPSNHEIIIIEWFLGVRTRR